MRKNWSLEEVEFLKEYVGLRDIDSLAKRLGRSTASVLCKLKRLKLGNTKEQSGYLTRGRLAALLGVDRNVVKYWCERYSLPFKTKKTNKSSRIFYLVDPIVFWEWANKNREKVDFSKIERNSILPEPDWVDSLRNQQKQLHYHPWTEEEEAYLIEQSKRKKQLYVIAMELDRSYYSVERKYKRMNEK